MASFKSFNCPASEGFVRLFGEYSAELLNECFNEVDDELNAAKASYQMSEQRKARAAKLAAVLKWTDERIAEEVDKIVRLAHGCRKTETVDTRAEIAAQISYGRHLYALDILPPGQDAKRYFEKLKLVPASIEDFLKNFLHYLLNHQHVKTDQFSADHRDTVRSCMRDAANVLNNNTGQMLQDALSGYQDAGNSVARQAVKDLLHDQSGQTGQTSKSTKPVQADSADERAVQAVRLPRHDSSDDSDRYERRYRPKKRSRRRRHYSSDDSTDSDSVHRSKMADRAKKLIKSNPVAAKADIGDLTSRYAAHKK